MNRRSFFTKLGLAAATLAILPTATTYARKWVAPTVARKMWIPNPAWESAPFEMAFLFDGNCLRYEQPDFTLPIVRFTKERGELVPVRRFIEV